MDRNFINRTNKRLKVLGKLKQDFNQMARDYIGQIDYPALKKQLLEAKQAALKGDRSKAEALLKTLQTK